MYSFIDTRSPNSYSKLSNMLANEEGKEKISCGFSVGVPKASIYPSPLQSVELSVDCSDADTASLLSWISPAFGLCLFLGLAAVVVGFLVVV